jgi:hypothetical protein
MSLSTAARADHGLRVLAELLREAAEKRAELKAEKAREAGLEHAVA